MALASGLNGLPLKKPEPKAEPKAWSTNGKNAEIVKDPKIAKLKKMIPRMSKKTESSGQALNHQQFGYEQLKQVADLQYVQMFFLFCTCRVWSSCGSKTFRLHNSCSSTDASSDLILKTEDAFQWSSTVYFVFRFSCQHQAVAL